MLQSIASVIQAVQPIEEIPTVEVGRSGFVVGRVAKSANRKQAIVNPIVQKIYEVLQASSSVSDFVQAISFDQSPRPALRRSARLYNPPTRNPFWYCQRAHPFR